MKPCLLLVAIYCCILAISCNKTDDYLHHGYISHVGIPHVGFNTDSLAGIFYCENFTANNNALGYAWFYDSTHNGYTNPGGYVLVNNDTLRVGDNINLATDNAYFGYIDPNATLHKWYFAGSGNIPEISYTHVGPYPAIGNIIPDSINISKGWTINLNAFTIYNADSVSVYIATDASTLKKTFYAMAGIVSISPQELSILFPSTLYQPTNYIYVSAYKIDKITKANKHFAFVKASQLQKMVSIRK